jgi:hypothetical protein
VLDLCGIEKNGYKLHSAASNKNTRFIDFQNATKIKNLLAAEKIQQFDFH